MIYSTWYNKFPLWGSFGLVTAMQSVVTATCCWNSPASYWWVKWLCVYWSKVCWRSSLYMDRSGSTTLSLGLEHDMGQRGGSALIIPDTAQTNFRPSILRMELLSALFSTAFSKKKSQPSHSCCCCRGHLGAWRFCQHKSRMPRGQTRPQSHSRGARGMSCSLYNIHGHHLRRWTYSH